MRPLARRQALRAVAGRFARDDRGGTAIEYGLIAALMVVVLIPALEGFADAAIDMWARIAGEMQDASGAG